MRKAAIFFALLILCGSAEARISKQTVNRAWQRMIQAAGFPNVPINYEADDDPNAWVHWQDGNTFTMHVTTGLMMVLDSEAEIAGVLGHEIGHVKCGHYDKMVLGDTASAILTTNLDRSEPLAQAIGKMNIELSEAAFSREDETEADNYGSALLKKAGYDAWGLYNAMKKLGVLEHNAFNSHPASRERLANLAVQARSGSSVRNSLSADSKSLDDIDDIASVMMGR